MVLLFTVLCGLAYPLAMTGVGQAVFGSKADGQLLTSDDGAGGGADGSASRVVGSALIGQSFTEPQYFHGRPSAVEYASGPASAHGSNEGPSSERLLTAVDERARAYREENGLAPDAEVPVDAVTASGSGLDPQISVANATIQARRVAAARGLDVQVVLDEIEHHTTGRFLDIFGEPGVNVLELNLALDAL
jgi:K+-transporting ATPase ATPase C chain